MAAVLDLFSPSFSCFFRGQGNILTGVLVVMLRNSFSDFVPFKFVKLLKFLVL